MHAHRARTLYGGNTVSVRVGASNTDTIKAESVDEQVRVQSVPVRSRTRATRTQYTQYECAISCKYCATVYSLQTSNHYL